MRTIRIKISIFIGFAVLLCSSLASAQGGKLDQNVKAVSFQDSCAHSAKLHFDKHKEKPKGHADDLYDTGQCVGYFRGLIDGLDDTGGWHLPDGTVARFRINRAAIDSMWDVIQAVQAYVDATPLAKGKPAWEILQAVLLSNGLATFTVDTPQPGASSSSDECTGGSTNTITKLRSDEDPARIATAPGEPILGKLIDCSK